MLLKILILFLLSNLSISSSEFYFGSSSESSAEALLPSVLKIEKSRPSDSKESNKKCEEITVPMCKNMEYNMTSMPNQFNHETQQEAASEAHQFWALVEINCSKELRFFLCSMYTPICVPNYAQPIKACRSVCVRARLGCEKYMKKFGFDWPEHMNCDLFPEYGSKDVCMDPIDAEEQKQRKKLTINIESETTRPNQFKINKNSGLKLNKKINLDENMISNDIIKYEIFNKNRDLELTNRMCEMPFIKLNDFNDYRFDKFRTSTLLNCIQPCHSVYFDSSERQFTYYWLILWSFLCLFSSFCTTCTYLIESSRFKYPEKPIIYLSICYLFVSIGYMIRFVVGHEQTACELDGSIKYTNMKGSETPGLSNNIGSLSCTISFILTYYFGMASSVWWVIISLTWFLAAGLKWGTESIAKYGVYFHLLAWVLPFFKTLFILFFSLIDADSLSGMCYVGNLNSYNLKMFVLLPSSIYLAIGITFLIAGFVSLVRIRNMIKRQQADSRKAHKLEKLMIRIGIFSILYTVPATCVIVCQLYELYYRKDWEKNILCKNKQLRNKMYSQYLSDEYYGLVEDFCSNKNTEKNFGQLPEFSIFMVKYFMSLIVGVTSGFWIWTGKSLKSWKKFFKRLFSNNTNDTNNETEDNQASLSEVSSETSCFGSIFSSQKRLRRLKKDSVVYFQANDEVEVNQQQFYQTASINKLNNYNFQQQHNQLPTKIIYNKPESIVSFPFNQNCTNTISTTSSNGQYLSKQAYCPSSNNQAGYFYDYNSSTIYKNEKPINTTTTTNGSSIPSVLNH